VQEESSNSQNVNQRIISCRRGSSEGSYRISLVDGSSFFISADFFIEHKLKKDIHIDSELLSKIVAESNYVVAYLKAISLLSKQSYTEFNLERKLLSNGFNIEDIKKALVTLRDKNLINDTIFAKKWVESRLRTKLDSPLTLISGLVNKGISNSIARNVVEELYSDTTENCLLEKIIEKSCRQGKTADKITSALLRKGFNRKKIVYYINKLGSSNESN